MIIKHGNDSKAKVLSVVTPLTEEELEAKKKEKKEKEEKSGK